MSASVRCRQTERLDKLCRDDKMSTMNGTMTMQTIPTRDRFTHDFFEAVKSGNVEKAEALITRSGVDPETLDGKAMEIAIEDGNLDLVRLLVTHGTDPSKTPWRYGNWLKLAIEQEQLDIFKLLADQNVSARSKDAALYYAVKCDAVEAARYIIAKGANVNEGDDQPAPWSSRLNEAARYGSAEMAQLLVDHGANLARTYYYPEAYIAVESNDVAVVRVLIRAMKQQNLKIDYNKYLDGAITRNREQAVDFLLSEIKENQIRINKNKLLSTSLSMAQSPSGNPYQQKEEDGRNAAIIRSLMLAGADPVAAWKGVEKLHGLPSSPKEIQKRANVLDACVDAITPAQCAALAPLSDQLIKISTKAAVAQRRRPISRGLPLPIASGPSNAKSGPNKLPVGCDVQHEATARVADTTSSRRY